MERLNSDIKNQIQPTSRQIQVAFIIDDLMIGGAQSHLINLIYELYKEYKITLVSLGNISQKFMTRIPENVHLVQFEMRSVRKISFWRNFFQLVAFLKNNTIDIVHTYLNTANVFGVLASKLSWIRIVVTSRRDMGHFRTKLVGFLEMLMSFLFADKVVSVCKSVALKTQTKFFISPKKSIVIYNGVDIVKFNKKQITNKSKELSVAIVASINRYMKGHKDFIEAAKKTLDIESNITFLIIGDGYLRHEIETLVNKLGIDKKVIFMGERKDIVQILDKVDILIVPSHSEGISNAALEAMSKGIPVIGTSIDGNIELIENNNTGFLVPVNSPDDISSCILKYYNDRNLLMKHGENARERVVNKFSIDKMAQDYRSLYRDLLDNKN